MKRGRKEGQALIYVGIFLLVFVSFAALVVDGARLYFAARETQAAADVAAIGGMLRLIETGNASDAVAGAQEAGNYPAAGYAASTLNVVDGQATTIDATNILVGHWSCSPAGNCTPTFTANAMPYNAVRVTPSYPISNLLPLWQTVSHPHRNATAAWLTLGTGIPGIPLLLANCFQCYSSNCPPYTQVIEFNSNSNNGAWYDPPPKCTICPNPCGTSDVSDYVPAVPGCNTAGSPGIPSGQGAGGQVSPTLNIRSPVYPTNGSVSGVCKLLQCLVNNKYLVPVVDTPCGSPINSCKSTVTVTGFATVKILGGFCVNKLWGICSNGSQCAQDTDCASGTCKFFDNPDPALYKNNAIKVQVQFVDCAQPENAPICSSQLTSECPGCGTGQVVMVE